MLYMPIPRGTEIIYTKDNGVTYKGILSAEFSGLNSMGVGHITLDPGWRRSRLCHCEPTRGRSEVSFTVQYSRGDRLYYWSPNN
ncbi:hypothetical protein AC578_3244 [Pseudocercospora eumusae]|uniref:Uncharacterized protein n=1 Tax=Pseudocercospora eumusae TaxID=321146 RepID=A0A139H211_9PEZI|nr:hypothetical protein AC578_3244 [Pseudocercospora eumusae]